MAPRIARVALTALLVTCGGVAPLLAEEEDPENKKKPDPEPYLAVATRATPGTPEIDGRLDEAAWALAEPISDFVQRDPNEGEPASERTETRVLYDDGAIYVGVRAYDSDPGEIIGQLTRRDQYSPSDWIVVSIDSYYDRRTAFEFRVNPAGVERDMFRYNDTWQDVSWNAVWDVATTIDDEGWIAEFRIPLSQLRFSEAEEQVWGFNIERVIQRKNETVQWKPIPKDASGWVSEYGVLRGLTGIEPPRRLELQPYVVAQQAFAPAQRGNPFEDGTETWGTVGGDLRYGVTNSLTLNMTINPDFGQVEADPSVVNLSAFETFFSERRPFFLEGANIFRLPLNGGGGIEQLFYSRRIGRRPQGGADRRGGYADSPSNTTIIGAAKLSGKSANGWSVGVLNAVTSDEEATVIDSAGAVHHDVVEPLTNYGVARIQKDFREGQSAVGGMFTAVNRKLTDNLSFLRSAAYTGGIDARHRFGDGNWELSGQVLGSYILGSREAIEIAQNSSARYFQRPDADHLNFDAERTSLYGTSGAFSFGKIGGGHWRGSLNTQWVSPGFETNDIGFQRSADVIRNNAWIGYREFQPGKVFRRYNLNWNAWRSQTFGGERTSTGTNINGSFTLLNYWGGWAGINREFDYLNIRVLRGGPAVKGPGAWNWWAGFFSDSRKPVSVEASIWRWFDDERSHAGGIWTGLTWRPVANVRLTAGPRYNWNHDDWQYVATANALGADNYVLGVLDQKTIAMTTRLDWTFTPNLSLQLYAQPFISSGNYTAFREVVAPKADVYEDRFARLDEDRLTYEPSDDPDEPGTYHVDLNADGTNEFSFADPNFNFKQLRSTVVLRWEYLSGSTLFFVWSQSKTASAFTGDFRPGRNLRELFDASGDNIFSIKLNYYINP
ncbi:MAG: hypothetical protein GWN99_06685 [Gemmatimonadetes bacterium]|uniref:Carbohydrate binding family 9 domain-containing protein n=1 Tax=Candidatus Kutchimonas denitrificans TaxID=3056748 RepID=A0AAE4Z5G0_9BACT|nr:hypothetical protein [Gemmatimonadota bacterium]NIR73699.1 hypothetical protein [Candidatus Kutchimonas denitrificans]NIS00749.1 hypothetical protein [Gemmatimonadota bacterium]NIT66336.1 hypothetical protein [Gemmatimonadota bacterium]NIU51554.1 hypothetical protein [Gemmatimonadota bacterium]